MPRPRFPKTLFEFQEWFPTERSCMEYLIQCRWPDGFVCPKCSSTRSPWLVETRRMVQCPDCRRQTFLTAYTIMEGTRTPLRIWFYAAFHIATHTPGFSAVQLQRELGIKRYETAFNILHKLRSAMIRPDRDKIHGLVEVDETYIGGPKSGKRGRGAEGKSIAIGAIEVLGKTERRKRAGRLRLCIIPNVQGRTLISFVKQNVEPRSNVQTDDWQGYDGLSTAGYRHQIVGNKELLRIHHTFGNLKTWLKGTHHGVSAKHLQAYVNEFVFRHNRRHTPMAAFQTVLGLAVHAQGPTYEQLYAAGKQGGWVHPKRPLRSLSRTG